MANSCTEDFKLRLSNYTQSYTLELVRHPYYGSAIRTINTVNNNATDVGERVVLSGHCILRRILGSYLDPLFIQHNV